VPAPVPGGVTCGLVVLGGAGSKVGGRFGARSVDRPADQSAGWPSVPMGSEWDAGREPPLIKTTRVWGRSGPNGSLGAKRYGRTPTASQTTAWEWLLDGCWWRAGRAVELAEPLDCRDGMRRGGNLVGTIELG
jgi:hypothetical protein